MLHRIDLPRRFDEAPIAAPVETFIAAAKEAIQTFQDRWEAIDIEQYVPSDIALVHRAVLHVAERPDRIGNRFLEWGCGFGIQTHLAEHEGWDAVGIEAVAALVQAGRGFVDGHWIGDHVPGGEIVVGNFLPTQMDNNLRPRRGSSIDARYPSLGHAADPAYEALGLDIDDFALVYSYPWPGEHDFHAEVFDRYAAPGAYHLQFRGPNEVCLFQKAVKR